MRETMRWVLAAAMCLVGIAHFLITDFFVSIMPPYLPWHEELVYLSGIIEITLGVLLALPKTRSLAAWGLIALFIAVFPANIHMALHDPELHLPAGMSQPPGWVAWARLPFQFLFIYWAYLYTKPRSRERSAS